MGAVLLLASGQLATSPRPVAAGIVAGAVGAAVGVVTGADLALAVHVLRVRVTGWAPITPDELISLRLEAVPLFVAPVVGAAIGFQSSTLLVHMGLAGLAGAGLCTVAGILVGQAVWGESEGRWAGGIVGGAVGLLLGAAFGFARCRRPSGPPRKHHEASQ